MPQRVAQGRVRHSDRVSVSLQTRCPKEALRLAKILEYHSIQLFNQVDLSNMDYVEARELVRAFYAMRLEKIKGRIDRDGPLPEANAAALERIHRDCLAIIRAGVDSYEEMTGIEYENESYDPLGQRLQEIMDFSKVAFPRDSKGYAHLKSLNIKGEERYLSDLLEYNRSFSEFSLRDAGRLDHPEVKRVKKGACALGEVMEVYLEEVRPNLVGRSFNEQKDCLAYLTDWLGHDFSIVYLELEQAREVKSMLAGTPKSRNKNGLTKGKALQEQIAIAKQNGMDCLSPVSVNKYLGYFDAFMGWAVSNQYTEFNPFSGIRVKSGKKKSRRRDAFSKEDIGLILSGLGRGAESSLVKNKSNYWGGLIAVYIGARRNEIAGLLPEDVKQDAASGIWYFDITDEQEEGKGLKSEAAKRIVPVHSRLLELGFLGFVEESKSMKNKIKQKSGYAPRLLYDLTYTDNEKWGRNLGRWFNDRFLKELGLKTDKKTLHSLRHSFIASLSAAGVESATIKSLVGHEPDTVTTQVYTHYGLEHLPVFKGAIEKLVY